MSRKETKESRKADAFHSQVGKQAQSVSLKEVVFQNKWQIFFCIVITFLCYISSALQNGFVNWDDSGYVYEDKIITTWNIIGLFTTPIVSCWQPVTMFCLMIEYHLFGLHPNGYHIVSLLLHCCNVLVAFLFILKFTKKPLIATIVALLFGIHPLHVESVAWVSEQKDLLYVFFYLLSLLTYLKYKEQGNSKWLYAQTAAFFVLACLSKAMAVVLPVTLVLIDCYLSDTWNFRFIAKSALRKSLFFVISIGVGIVAYSIQKADGTVREMNTHQLIPGCYGLLIYGMKFFIPVSLSAVYPFPIENAAGAYPFIVRCSPFIVLGLLLFTIGIIWRRVRKKRTNRVLLFGLLFFFVNIILVLQFIPFGKSLLSERYTYLSFLGPFFSIAMVIQYSLERMRGTMKLVVKGGLGIYAILLAWATFTDSKVWHDGVTLWSNAIQHSQSNVEAYINRAAAYINEEKFDSSIADCNKVFLLSPNSVDGYTYRAFAYLQEKKYDPAIADCNKAILLSPNSVIAYMDRSLNYDAKGNYEDALQDAYTAKRLGLSSDIENYIQKLQTQTHPLSPDSVEIYTRRAAMYVNEKKFDAAIADCNRAILLSPNSVDAYINRSVAYGYEKKYDAAITDCSKAILLSPDSAKGYINRSVAYGYEKKYDAAIADCNKAILLSPNSARAYYNRSLSYDSKGNYSAALQDAYMAERLGQSNDIESYIQNLQTKTRTQVQPLHIK